MLHCRLGYVPISYKIQPLQSLYTFLFLWIHTIKNIPFCKQYLGFEDYFSRIIRTYPLKNPTNSISLDSGYKFLVEEFTENSFEDVQPELLKR